MKNCPFCQGVPQAEMCGQMSGLKLICTREKGHSGRHVACGLSAGHEIQTWENEQKPAKDIEKGGELA